MRWTRVPLLLGVVVAAVVLGGIALLTTGTKPAAAATVQSLLTSKGTAPWAQQNLKGNAVLAGQVPLAVVNKQAGFIGRQAPSDVMRLNFALPLRDMSTLNQLIAVEAKTHQTVSRAELYARFSPSQAQIAALEHWLTQNGFTITHVGADRLTVAAEAPTSTVEKALNVRINDYTHQATTFGKIDRKSVV